MPHPSDQKLEPISTTLFLKGRVSRRSFLAAGLFGAPGIRSQVRGVQPGVEFLSYERVAPLLTSCNLELPKELAGRSEDEIHKEWPGWIQNRDREIRSRLLQGEEDSLVNFVLFGVSFTNQPRIVPDNSVSLEDATHLFQTRVQHFIAGISTPGNS